jgi:CheY-like chemotaxis protein
MTKKILVIDDDKDITDLLEMRLKASGYNVATALNGEEGLRKVAGEKPDLIALDVMMPVMDGFEFFKTIKTTEYKDIPIVILTGRGSMKDTFEAFDVDGFIAKPYDPEDLISKIRLVLQDKALALSDDAYVIEKIKTSLKPHQYELHAVKTEKEFMEMGRESKYKFIVIHLPFLRNTPEEAVLGIKGMRHKNPVVIIYSDARVEGTEDNSTLAITAIKTKWERAGVGAFYDSRMEGRTFSEFVARLAKR